MQTRKYQRKPFKVEAVQVTEENMSEVAEWCGGEILREGDAEANRYIRVPVRRPLYPKQTQAFVGCWVLGNDRGFKVYTNEAFNKSFELEKSDITIHHAEGGGAFHRYLAGDGPTYLHN